MPTVFNAFVVSQTPAPQVTRIHCATDTSSSSLTASAMEMSGLVADLQAKQSADPGAQIFVAQMGIDMQARQGLVGDNFVTRGARVFIARPVVVGD